MSSINVYKRRTTTVIINLGVDISADTFVGEIRTGKTVAGELIATWDISFVTDGKDGLLKLLIDDSDADQFTYAYGYTDLKRVIDNEPVPVFLDPLKILFKDPVTT
jgi:hypothetical protein